MARPRKTGLDYFPFDVDFFDDEKIVCVGGEFGIKGEMVAVRLLCAIYRNGYFIEWSDMLRMKMLRQMPCISAELLDQIVNRLVRWGFFDASLFDSVKVLSSVGIQRRYFEISKRRKGNTNLPYLLVSVAETRVNVAETIVNVAEMPQSKVKERKEDINVDKNACEDDFDELVEKFFAPERRIALEAFCMHQRTSEDELRELAWQIVAEWRLGGVVRHRDEKEGFGHMLNTLRIKLDAERRKQTNESSRNNRLHSPSSGIPIKGRIVPSCGLKRPDKK